MTLMESRVFRFCNLHAVGAVALISPPKHLFFIAAMCCFFKLVIPWTLYD